MKGNEHDPELLALAEELAIMGSVEVPAAARHRGWARVREELAAAPVASGTRRAVARPRLTLRLAAGAVLVAGAAVLAVVGLQGPREGQVAVTDTTITSVTAPATSGTEPETSTTVVSPSTDTTTPDTAVPPESTLPPATGGPGDEQTTTIRTVPSVSTTVPATTVTIQPATSTTARQVLTREQRESSARSVASFLAQAVIARDQNAAASVVAPSGASGLALMFASLEDPATYRIISVDASEETSARVLLEIVDRRRDHQGELVQVGERFILLLRLDAGGVYVNSIYAAGRQ
jgi:hypothetical protein